jgi:hypothetical protein
MIDQRQLPSFATADWYSNPSDHRCPHDAWLDALEISEPAEGSRKEKRKTAIVARLFGAYHDGSIVIRYSDVKSFSTSCEASERGFGDWMEDAFEVSGDALVHRVTWQRGSWTIAAAEISYEWIPKTG